MSAYVRQITINGSGNGGRAQGTWLRDGVSFTSGTPSLQQNDTLQVQIVMSGGNTPGSLTGYLIVGPAPDAPTSQAAASPFASGNNQICVTVYPNVTPTGSTFAFSPVLTLPNQNRTSGKFELTFVAVDPVTGRQWEEDPEFDTGN
jgi:hypothetical protein